jgi:hypothetical protein
MHVWILERIMAQKVKNIDWTNKITWAIYALLLGVLWPHTAWAFEKFEPMGLNRVLAWALAGAFEAGIAVFTHKLSVKIGTVPNYQAGRWPIPQLKRINGRYLNIEGLGLFVTWGVSSLANLAHSVEFGQTMAIFDDWGIPSGVYSVAFGAVLPFMSLLFAWVLSNVSTTEHQEDERLTKANADLREIRKALKAVELRATEAEREAKSTIETANKERIAAEQKYRLYEQLFGEDARGRILAARALLPSKSQATWAKVAQSSPGYVSEIIAANGSGKEE